MKRGRELQVLKSIALVPFKEMALYTKKIYRCWKIQE